MSQIVSNRTGRKKIFYKGDAPEIKVFAEQNKNYLKYKTELNLNPESNYKSHYKITIQAYEKNGSADKPYDMGTVGSPSNLASVTVKDINIDSVLFRLKIVDENNVIKGYASQIPVVSERDPSDEESLNKNRDSKNNESDTILPVQETNNINVPFRILMNAGQKPILQLKANLNLKEKLRNDIITKTLIYTAAIKEILTKYLIDQDYKNDPNKNIFIDKIRQNCGEDLPDPPQYFLESDNTISTDASEWIDAAVEGCLNRTVNFQNKQSSIFSIFSEICKKHNLSNSDED
jgi:hypothetical protein